MNLEGKRAIVTGGASGIGAAIVERLANDGASVLIADKNYAGAKQLAASLSASNNKVWPIEVDVASSSSVKAMIDSCVSELGGLDVLVNNAGIVHREDTDAEATPEEVWDLTLDVNLKSVFLCSKYAIPLFEKGGAGSIINIASIVAILGSFPSQIAYTASKGGILAMSRELAVALARRKIRVNAICPGLTATPMAAQLVEDDSAYQLRRLHIPMGRMGLPAEIAATVAFLASDDASYVTGQSIAVDGGMTGAYLTPPDSD
jgi:NAD(P)-dependent dehydrogenase (short-subunit alcohol dehydrogenase family)